MTPRKFVLGWQLITNRSSTRVHVVLSHLRLLSKQCCEGQGLDPVGGDVLETSCHVLHVLLFEFHPLSIIWGLQILLMSIVFLTGFQIPKAHNLTIN